MNNTSRHRWQSESLCVEADILAVWRDKAIAACECHRFRFIGPSGPESWQTPGEESDRLISNSFWDEASKLDWSAKEQMERKYPAPIGVDDPIAI